MLQLRPISQKGKEQRPLVNQCDLEQTTPRFARGSVGGEGPGDVPGKHEPKRPPRYVLRHGSSVADPPTLPRAYA